MFICSRRATFECQLLLSAFTQMPIVWKVEDEETEENLPRESLEGWWNGDH